MCDQNDLKNEYVTNLKIKGLMCDQNNLNDQFITNLKLKGPLHNLALFNLIHSFGLFLF